MPFYTEKDSVPTPNPTPDPSTFELKPQSEKRIGISFLRWRIGIICSFDRSARASRIADSGVLRKKKNDGRKQ